MFLKTTLCAFLLLSSPVLSAQLADRSLRTLERQRVGEDQMGFIDGTSKDESIEESVVEKNNNVSPSNRSQYVIVGLMIGCALTITLGFYLISEQSSKTSLTCEEDPLKDA